MGWGIYEAKSGKETLTFSTKFTGFATGIATLGLAYLILGKSAVEVFSEDMHIGKIKFYQWIIIAGIIAGTYFLHDIYTSYLETLGYENTTRFGD